MYGKYPESFVVCLTGNNLIRWRTGSNRNRERSRSVRYRERRGCQCCFPIIIKKCNGIFADAEFGGKSDGPLFCDDGDGSTSVQCFKRISNRYGNGPCTGGISRDRWRKRKNL